MLGSNNSNVILLQDEFNTIELEHIIKQFDFIITSRYHSIIHAYNNITPAIVIGWADKYVELLEFFNQLDYFIDCTNLDKNIKIKNKIKKMIIDYTLEKNTITEKLNDLPGTYIFNDLE